MYQTKRLHVIPMTKKGKNAADFVLSFYGGMAKLLSLLFIFISSYYIYLYRRFVISDSNTSSGILHERLPLQVRLPSASSF